MKYLLDTNILLVYLRDSDIAAAIDIQLNPFGIDNVPVISIVTVGEMHSLAIRNRWGKRRMQELDELLNLFVIADINIEEVIKLYAEIDAFSQGLHPFKPLGSSARNMGKNDLWIAATAAAADLRLLTTDKDFNHLKDTFVDLVEIELFT